MFHPPPSSFMIPKFGLCQDVEAKKVENVENVEKVVGAAREILGELEKVNAVVQSALESPTVGGLQNAVRLCGEANLHCSEVAELTAALVDTDPLMLSTKRLLESVEIAAQHQGVSRAQFAQLVHLKESGVEFTALAGFDEVAFWHGTLSAEFAWLATLEAALAEGGAECKQYRAGSNVTGKELDALLWTPLFTQLGQWLQYAGRRITGLRKLRSAALGELRGSGLFARQWDAVLAYLAGPGSSDAAESRFQARLEASSEWQAAWCEARRQQSLAGPGAEPFESVDELDVFACLRVVVAGEGASGGPIDLACEFTCGECTWCKEFRTLLGSGECSACDALVRLTW